VQDCLSKRELGQEALARAVRFAILRHRTNARLLAESLTDELTGLYNRRGLLRVGGQLLDGARRRGCGAWLLFADVQGLKEVNDRFGHAAGDRSLRAAAQVLRRSFRSADVLARLGGDEFTVLAVDAALSSRDVLVERLLRGVEAARTSSDAAFVRDLAVGTACFRPGAPDTVEDLVRIAGEEAAARKCERRSGRAR
jgi:diguanylate cyclase (GGDEF)-like protein